MTLIDKIQDALKSKNIVIGIRESIRYIKMGDAKLIVMSNNIPVRMKKEIEHNAKVSGAKIETFNGNSMELGVVCGKYFPITALVIK